MERSRRLTKTNGAMHENASKLSISLGNEKWDEFRREASLTNAEGRRLILTEIYEGPRPTYIRLDLTIS